MKNTRKKMLLSSIAMLLVALIALGSATFAWFTANPNADATGISMKTTAAAGLVISTDTDTTWSHHAALNKNGSTFNATPVSQDQTTPANFWTVIANAADAYGAKGSEAMTPAVAGTDFYTERIYCRLSDGSDATANASKKVYLKGVTITAASGATMQNCMRVAIAGPNGLLGTYALSTAGAHGTLTTAGQTEGSFTNLAATSTSLNVDTGLTALAATGSDLTKYITVYVYLDGQDQECYSDKVGTVNASEIISSVQVDLTLA